MYDKLFKLLSRFFKPSFLFKIGFNWLPMYRRSTGKIIFVSEDLHLIKIKIPLSYKNVNYVGTIFGGSLFSATDPIYMVQLIQILGNEYVIWDKKSEIVFKRPASEIVYATFKFTKGDIEKIKTDVLKRDEIDLIKIVKLKTKNDILIAQINKTIYISSKTFYKQKKAKRNQ